MDSPSVYICALMLMCVSSAYAGCAQHKLDVIAVMDGSGSIGSDDFVKQKDAVIQLAQGLNLAPNGQRFGALVFSTSVTDIVSLNSNFYNLRAQISAIKYPRGGTYTHLAIQAMKQMFQSQSRSAKKVGIVITDGKSKSSRKTSTAASIAKANGISMFAIGVGSGSNRDELNAIASTSSNVVYLDNFNQLKSKFKSLIKKLCPVDGGWSSWSRSSSGSCSRTCGGGTRTVTMRRTCTNPRPSNGGKQCPGSTGKTYTESCNTNCCATAGGWSPWKTQSRSSCSKTCGGGVITVQQSRTCTNPTPACGGPNCRGSSRKTYTEICNTRCCPVSGGWSTWKTQSKSSCSKTCGGGVSTVQQSRSCTNPRPACGGPNCAGSAKQTYTEGCNSNCCPSAGGWSNWKTNSRSSCSKTCGGGFVTVQQSRSCINPPPSCGGPNCTGSATNVFTESCNTFNCPIHGGWTKWATKSRSDCSATCGGGVITVQQTRSCTNPAPKYGGINCSGSENNIYTVPCNTFACPSCDGCLFENGVGFLPHPTDCRFFVQCFERGSSYVIKQCPAGLYWNQELLTCTFPSATNCTTTATIVPPVDLMSTVPPPPPPPPGPCEKKAVPGKPSSYSENVDSYGVLESQCAPGTVFDIAACGCVHGGTALPPGCKDELYLPLSKDLKDHSSHKLYVESNGVKITNSGMASFANNAVIRIHRFSNMDFGKTLDISFLLHKTQNTSKDEAVVTNAECKRTGSIYIILKTSDIEFRVANQKGAMSTVTVPLTKATDTVRLNVHKGVMTGEVNGIRKKTSFKGRIGRVLCALQIGRGHGLASFTGMLKDFKMSLCRP